MFIATTFFNHSALKTLLLHWTFRLKVMSGPYVISIELIKLSTVPGHAMQPIDRRFFLEFSVLMCTDVHFHKREAFILGR